MVDLNKPASENHTGWGGTADCTLKHRAGDSHWRPTYDGQGGHEHWYEDGVDVVLGVDAPVISRDQKWLPSLRRPAEGIRIDTGNIMIRADRGLLEISPENILENMGIDPTETNLEHYHTLMVAMKKYDERNTVHQDLWKKDGMEGTIPHLTHKLRRVKRFADSAMIANDGKPCTIEELDDSIDMINYAAFMIRNGLAGRTWSTEDELPEDDD